MQVDSDRGRLAGAAAFGATSAATVGALAASGWLTTRYHTQDVAGRVLLRAATRPALLGVVAGGLGGALYGALEPESACSRASGAAELGVKVLSGSVLVGAAFGHARSRQMAALGSPHARTWLWRGIAGTAVPFTGMAMAWGARSAQR